MTDNEINMKVAEKVAKTCGVMDHRFRKRYNTNQNAMHMAETVLTFDQQYDYGEELRRITGNAGPRGGRFVLNGFGCFALAHATAHQRAEAFLRILGEWKEPV